MTNQVLSDLFDYYLAQQDDFVEKYNGQVVAIKDNKVIGAYADYVTAFFETGKTHEPETFLLQRVSPGPEAYTVRIYSPRLLPS